MWISRIIDITNQVIKKLDNDFVINLDFNSDSIEVGKLKKALRHNRVRDKMLGNASTGSHKDKISFLVKKADIFNFGSEGEKKTVALAIKISEILILKKIEGNFPLILIDEIGNADEVLKKKFGDDVIIKKFEKPKSWIGKRLSSANESQIIELVKILEERSIWQRYGF